MGALLAQNLHINSNQKKLSSLASYETASKDGTTLDELLNNADKTLYFAKATGPARVISFSTDLFEKRDDTLIPN